MNCNKKQDCCSYEFLKELVSGGDPEHVNKIVNELQIQNKTDAIEAIPRLFKERDAYWRNLLREEQSKAAKSEPEESKDVDMAPVDRDELLRTELVKRSEVPVPENVQIRDYIESV